MTPGLANHFATDRATRYRHEEPSAAGLSVQGKAVEEVRPSLFADLGASHRLIDF
jgi:hypothetical protein